MTAAGQVNAGSRITAAMVRGTAPLSAYKGASQPLASQTALQNDNALYIELLANAIYHFELTVFYNGPSGNTMTQGLVLPSGATCAYSLKQLLSGGSFSAGYYESGNPPAAYCSGTGTTYSIEMKGTIVVASAGTLQYQWAQGSSSATDTTVQAGSDLVAWQTG